MVTSIERIRRRIVEALTRGQPTAELEKELRQARLDELARGDMSKLEEIATRSKAWQNQAAAVQTMAKEQDRAIDVFLSRLNGHRENLRKSMEQLKALQPQLAEAVRYSLSKINDDVKSLPKGGYLPEGAAFPEVTRPGGLATTEYLEEINALLQKAYDYMNCRRESLTIQILTPVEQSPFVDTDDEPAEIPSAPEVICRVCSHPQRAEIEQSLRDGASLRDIANEFGVSKSTVDRHKAHLEG